MNKNINWQKIKNDYENSELKITQLATLYDVSKSSISKHKKAEQWHKRDNDIKVTKVLDNTDFSEKRKMFILEYLTDYNGTRAYQSVYKCKYSTARVKASQLLAKPEIKQQIKTLKRQQQASIYATTDDIINKLLQMFMVNLDNYVSYGTKQIKDDNGNSKAISYVNFKDSDQTDNSLIESVSNGVNGANIKTYNKLNIAKILLDCLPQPVGEITDNPLITAIKQSNNSNQNIARYKEMVKTKLKEIELQNQSHENDTAMEQVSNLLDALENGTIEQ